MIVAVSAEGTDLAAKVDPRFGRARYFLVIDTEKGLLAAHDNTANRNAAQGAGIQAGKSVVQLGVEAVLTGNVGPKAFGVLKAAGVKMFLVDGGTAQEAVEQLKAGLLREVDQANVEGRWA